MAGGTGSALDILTTYKKDIKHTIDDIVKPSEEVTPSKPTEEEDGKVTEEEDGKVTEDESIKDFELSQVQIRIKDGLVFKPTDNQPYRQVRNLIPNFNEAVKGR